MINSISEYTTKSAPQTLAETVSQIKPMVAITLGGMACFTIIFCIGSIVFSGCDMTLSSDGMTIKHPIRNDDR